MCPVIVQLLFKSFWFFLPAFCASMIPPIAAKRKWLLRLAGPIDNNGHWRGRRIFGQNKTWRGFICGVGLALVVIWLQHLAYLYWGAIKEISLFDYRRPMIFGVGFLLGFGALIGDLVKSFVKRRIGIKPGEPFIPWDQIDQVIGAALFVSILFWPPWQVVITALVFVFFGTIITNQIGYKLKIRKFRW